MSEPDNKEVLNYVDVLMEAIGELTMSETLAILLDLAAHTIMDDIRIHVTLGPGIVTEKRITSGAFAPLARVLRNAGLTPSGFAGEEVDDDSPIPFTTVSLLGHDDDDDDDLLFQMGDE